MICSLKCFLFNNNLLGVFHLSITKDSSTVESNVYIFGKGRLYFPSLLRWVGKISNMFDISPTLPDSCSRPCLHSSGNRFVLVTSSLVISLPVLSLSLPVLSYHETDLSFVTSVVLICSPVYFNRTISRKKRDQVSTNQQLKLGQ